MKKLFSLYLAGVSVALLGYAGVTQATPVAIEGLFATGVDDYGSVTSGGPDLHYKIVNTRTGGTKDAYVLNNIVPDIKPGEITVIPGPQPKLGWIWSTNNGKAYGEFVFRQAFDLTGFDLSTVQLAGAWMADDYGMDILLNGVSTKQKLCGASALCKFDLRQGFVEGMNTIDFVVKNSSGIGGFHVASIGGAGELVPPPSPPPAPVPEPGSGALLLIGLGLFATVAQRRRIQSAG